MNVSKDILVLGWLLVIVIFFSILIIYVLVSARRTMRQIRKEETLQKTSMPILVTDEPEVQCSRRVPASVLAAAGYSLQAAQEKVQMTAAAFKEATDSLAQLADQLPEVQHVGTSYHLKNFELNWHDIWVGVYWTYKEYFEMEDDGDYDALTFFICPLPCVLFSFTRLRHYQIIPKVQQLDRLCLDCGASASVHPCSYTPAGMNDMVGCEGRY